ncbi:hypothetical protein JXA84_01025 [candidate division WOR-3 bacterium]|nr:hypothetical protein [candidate division WOR-3 bacterium]
MRKILSSVFIFVAFLDLSAGKTNNFVLDSYSDFYAGKFENVMLSYTGTIEVSREIIKIMQSDITHTMKMAECEGRYYFASVSPAGIYSCDVGEDDIDTVAAFEDGGVFALATDGRDVFAAVSPKGDLLKISRSEREIIFHRDSLSVWDMIYIGNGRIALGTSDQGKVYILSVEGEFLDSFETGDESVVSLASRGDTVYAGTSGKGLLVSYSISGKKVYIADDPEGSEVNSIFAGKDILVYSSISGDIDLTGLSSLRFTVDPYFHIPASSSEITSRVYKYQEGKSELLFVSPNPPVTSLFMTSEREVLAIGSPDGSVFVYNLEKEDLEVFKAPEEKILTSWVFSPDGAVDVLAANPLTLFRISPRKAEEALFTTNCIFGGQNPVWGEIYLSGEGSWRIQARTGNTSSPGDLWSNWSREFSIFSEVKNDLPPGKNIQFRISFDGSIEKIEFLFSSENQKPEIDRIEVFAPGSAFYGVSQVLPDLKTTSFSDTQRRMLLVGGWRIPENPIAIQNSHQGIYIEASDPEDDSLVYDFFLKEKTRTEWIRIGWVIKAKSYAFNRRFFSDGEYQIMAIVSDSISNPADNFLSDTAYSEDFTIDNTPPTVSDFSGSNTVSSFTVRDSRSRIISASYSFDGINWTSMEPKDGVFDSKSESFDVQNITVGSELIMIRAEDSHLNQSYSYFSL